jgi:acyl dehydratase/NAD(P)-dependent dehydrogenase (short-subunit alcohol dehydrogenase family)
MRPDYQAIIPGIQSPSALDCERAAVRNGMFIKNDPAMIEQPALARKTFDYEAQRQFAALSGDHNPMHLDALAARRTQAGAPVVHGIHLLIWALDVFAARHQATSAPLRSLQVRFSKFVYVGETADVFLIEEKPLAAKLSISVEGTSVCVVTIEVGELSPASGGRLDALAAISVPPAPHEIQFENMDRLAGRLAHAAAPGAFTALFPAATAWLGASRIAGLATTSCLVGMVCPGLHSIYSSLSAEFHKHDDPTAALSFQVTNTDSRFRRVRMSISGCGLSGTINSFARMPPVLQPTTGALAGSIQPGEFSGAAALIIGGSRGIGELTAKLIAAGGGRVVITYARGSTDAHRVADDIRSAGGMCEVIQYDACELAAPQLSALTDVPTHLYYFATPSIFGRQSDGLSTRRLNDFMAVYVSGFYRLVESVRPRRPDLSILYPSSAAVAERPPGMTEYAMAKAAGEILCADLNAALAPLRIKVARLPRIETDQTATFVPVDTSDPIETMLPLIREVQSPPPNAS